ncbi:MAG: AMP-binding protein, partial [Bacteroidota bacterium]|nr:AMP-binding protein [Bacteroidota bacterium]
AEDPAGVGVFCLAPREVSHVLRDASPELFIWQEQFAATAMALDGDVQAVRTLRFDGEDSLVARMFNESCPATAVQQHATFDTPCMILYTSGTTGAPKGAVITHGMLFWNSVNTSMRLNLVQSDVTLTFAPFFHTGGWNVLTTPFLHRGGHVVLVRKFDPAHVLTLCDTMEVSVLFGVPTMMDMMAEAENFAHVSLASVRYAIVGGEPMPLDLIRTWQAKGVPIRQGYGLTEFGPNVFSLNEEDAERKIGSIGFPNFYIDTRVVDDAGRDCADGEVGELLLRGPVCTPGYWNNPAATEAAFTDGWLRTGDLVRRDREGYYYVVDRKKDMFISGAENVYPAEIEHFLRAHPDVQAVAVTGVPDARWGEVGKAWIVLEEGAETTEEDILAYCAGELARYKIPRYVAFLNALPVSDSGKILKKQLRQIHDARQDH